MPRAVSVKQYNTFVKGLVTEASPLTYPENASLDEDNFVLKRNGSRERRLGLDYEIDYALTATGLTALQIEEGKQSFHKWDNPGGDTTVSIGVVRIYNKLWFVDLLTSSPSANLLNGGSAITLTNLVNADIETAVINNLLVIVSSDLPKPIKLAYDSATDTVSQEEITISVRDLWGIQDGLATDERPITLSALHKYNLRNQGWSEKVTSTCGTDAIDCTFTEIAAYPSNADIWTLGKIGDATSANFEKYDPASMVKNSIDNAFSAKGSFVINAFNRGADRISKSGLVGLPLDREENYLTTVASYAGRIFYSGIVSNITGKDTLSPNYSGYIFFSQVVTSTDKLGKCYQEADPTSPNISDIIDTDGGAIQIPEATRIYRLVSTQSSLLVFAENGIWEIFGDTNGFVATSYQAAKLASTGTSSPKSIVEALGTIFAWTKAGIYVVAPDQASGRYKAENISLLTIQTLYNDLTDIAKNNARGFYDEKENTIRWLYNDLSAYSTTSYVNRYNRELVLDLTLQAFYSQTLAATSPYVADYAEIPNYTVATVNEAVLSGTDTVLSDVDSVVIPADVVLGRTTQFSFLTIVGTSFTLGKYISRTFKDWYTFNTAGVNYSSYIVTGYEIFGDIMRTKNVPYIWFYFTKTEDGFTEDGAGDLQIDNPSSCLVKAKWNWTDSATSGQWGSQFQAYRFNRNYIPSGPADTFDNGYEVIVTKSKLRGNGRSLSLLIESEAGKDMKLLGWAVMVSAEGTP